MKRTLSHQFFQRALFSIILVTAFFQSSRAQTAHDRHESERGDRLGRVEQADFEPNQPDIFITLNVPSFRLTLWQNGKEVKSYYVGVGLKQYPIYIGEREATEIIWNPTWVPPSSDWVRKKKGVRAGEVIKASDPRNPLGKMKIPLGDSYLLHQAASNADVGNLVSHGCVRMLRADLYDLAEKIIAARSAPVSRKRIEAAKHHSQTYAVILDAPVSVDINYDTLVVENGQLHIYPDIYERSTNRTGRLREELRSAGIDVSGVDEETLKAMLGKVKHGTQFVANKKSIEEGRALEDGELLPVVPKAKKPGRRRR